MAVEYQDSRCARFALRCSNWAERWFPDSWVFAALAVIPTSRWTIAPRAPQPTWGWVLCGRWACLHRRRS